MTAKTKTTKSTETHAKIDLTSPKRQLTGVAVGALSAATVAATIMELMISAVTIAMSFGSFFGFLVYFMFIMALVWMSVGAFTQAHKYIVSGQIDLDIAAVRNWFKGAHRHA
jgi:hypothetical protein